MCVQRHNLIFRPLGRFAPVAVNSGLRPETCFNFASWFSAVVSAHHGGVRIGQFIKTAVP